MSRRSFWAWGLEQDEPTEQQVREAAARLSQRYGVNVEPVMPPRVEDLRLRAPRIGPPGSLAAICATDDHDRAVHTYGRSFRMKLRQCWTGCSSNGYAAIPYGGGSSTVGGVRAARGLRRHRHH